MYKSFLFLLLFSTLTVSLSGQEKSAFWSCPDSCKILDIDILGNIYYISGSDVFSKRGIKENRVYTYNDQALGLPSSIDVSNPMKILLFFSDYGQLMILDNTLSPLQELNLIDDSGIVPTIVCHSSDNSIWVHDQIKNVLLKLSQEGKVQSSSEDLMMLTGIGVKPELLFEKNNQVFLRDVNGTYFIFDNMGNFDSNFCVGDLPFCGYAGNSLCYLEENELYGQHPDDWKRFLLYQFDQLPAFIKVLDKYIYYSIGKNLYQLELVSNNKSK
jgi:hypothetical protein